MRQLVFAIISAALAACNGEHGLNPAWVPDRSEALVEGAAREPIDRLCLPERKIAPRITVACGGFLNVTGLATDANGNLYVVSPGYFPVSHGPGQMYEIETTGRIVDVTSQSLHGLYGVTVTSAANVYASTTTFQNRTHTSHAAIYAFTAPGKTPRRIVAHLSYAYALASDAQSNVYAATNKGVLEIAPSHKVVRRFAGISTWPLAVNSAGDLYVADSYHGVTRIARDGTKTPLPGNYSGPNAIAVDAAGNVFVHNNGFDDILEITPRGKVRTLARGIGDQGGFAAGPDGSLYVGGNESVARIAPDGAVTYTGPVLSEPSGLAFDAAGNMYAALPALHSVVKIGSDATFTAIGSRLRSPRGVAVDRKGDVYIADDGRPGSVEIVSASGKISLVRKGLAAPTAIAVDSKGSAYVADGKSVKRIDSAGNVVTLLTVMEYNGTPSALATDARGNVYVSMAAYADIECFGAIYEIAPNGEVSKIDPQFSSSCVFSIASDSRGDLYISQRRPGGPIVREIDADGGSRIVASGVGPASALTLDGSGHIYASLPFSNAIYRISL